MWRKTIQFRRLELLGEGGQGSVFKAERCDRQTSLRQIVALKILHSKTAVELWRQEFESLSRVRSPYCVQVLFFERVGRHPALVLEYVDGISLAQLGQSCWLDDIDLTEINAQLEQALKALHAQGVFHGDLSPQNVLLDRQGRIRVLDFGLANGAGANLRVTPQFASPERLMGAESDAKTDLFSLGRVLEFLGATWLNDSSYMNSNPDGRHFQDLSPCEQRQKRLSEKVVALLRRRVQNASLVTRTAGMQTPRLSLSRLGLLLSTIGVLSVASPASQSRSASQIGVLSVRTLKWHYFLLDGRPVGYAPFSLPLMAAQKYHLEWISAEGRGTAEVAVKAHEMKVLEDRDFSH